MTRARPAPPALLAALAALSLSACAGVGKVISGAFERPRLQLETVGVEAIDLEGATAVARYRVENPNGFSLTVARLSYQLDVEGQQVVAGSLPGGLRLPARGAAPLVIPVRVRYADVPAFLERVTQRDHVAYRVAGSVGFDTALGAVDIPWSHTGEVPLPKLPAFSVDSVRLSGAGFTGLTVALKIRLGNRNAFPIPGGRLDYRLDLNGAPAVRAAAASLASVPAGGSTVVDVPVKVDLLAAGMGAGQALAGGRTEVALSGSAAWGSLRIPVDLRGASR